MANENPFRETLILEAQIQRACEKRREVAEKIDKVADRRTKAQLLRKCLSFDELLASLFESARCKYLKHSSLEVTAPPRSGAARSTARQSLRRIPRTI